MVWSLDKVEKLAEMAEDEKRALAQIAWGTKRKMKAEAFRIAVEGLEAAGLAQKTGGKWALTGDGLGAVVWLGDGCVKD